MDPCPELSFLLISKWGDCRSFQKSAYRMHQRRTAQIVPFYTFLFVWQKLKEWCFQFLHICRNLWKIYKKKRKRITKATAEENTRDLRWFGFRSLCPPLVSVVRATSLLYWIVWYNWVTFSIYNKIVVGEEDYKR